MVVARRYGYLGWPGRPTRHPRARVIWSALAALPLGRFLSALRASGSHPAQALRAAVCALAEPWAALFLTVPKLLRFDLESAAFHIDYLNLAPREARVGVVIVNTRQPDQLIHCVRSFQSVEYSNLQWIVVANSAQDHEVERLRLELPGVEWVVTQENLGYTGANNLGIQRALDLGCEYLLVMNDDTECLAGDFITRLVSFLDLNPTVAEAGPRVYLRERGRVQNTILRYPSLFRNLFDWFGYRLAPGRYHLSGNRVRTAEMLNGVCILLRAEAIRQVGAFDAWLFMYVEDADLGLRLRRAGWKIVYIPVDSILHLQKESGYDLESYVSLLMRRNSAYFLRKHHKTVEAWGFAAANLTLSLGRVLTAGSAEKFRRRLAFCRALWREFCVALSVDQSASGAPDGSPRQYPRRNIFEAGG
jgi:GT2 family glycosyltransferase